MRNRIGAKLDGRESSMGVGWEWDWVLNWFGIGTGQEWISVGVGGSGIDFDHLPLDWEGLGLECWEW